MVLQEFGQFLGGELLAATIEENQKTLLLISVLLMEGRLIFEGNALGRRVARQSLQIFLRERFNGWLFGFADPCNFEFHGKIRTRQAGKLWPISQLSVLSWTAEGG